MGPGQTVYKAGIMFITKWSQFLTAKIQKKRVGAAEYNDIEYYLESNRADILEKTYCLSHITEYSVDEDIPIAGWTFNKDDFEQDFVKDAIFFTEDKEVSEIVAYYKFTKI